MSSSDISRRRSAIMLCFFTLSLFINRVLDYWPMGVVFCLVLGIAFQKDNKSINEFKHAS